MGPRTLVSVVIAAYGRVEALRRAMRSALRQTHEHLEVLVVADAADEAFLSSVPREDGRVRLLNLTQRAGAQYGPNSIGMQHARGDVIAFLNHDDLWLEDHLEHGLGVMAAQGSTFHFATAAFIRPRERPPLIVPVGSDPGSSEHRLSFDGTNGPFERWRTAHRDFTVFEPASAWLVDAALASRVGPWPKSMKMKVTKVMPGWAMPASRWIARADREGGRFSESPLPTVVKVNLHHAASEPTYATEGPEHALLERILVVSAAEVRADIATDLAPTSTVSEWAVRRARERHRSVLRARVAYVLFRATGDDRFLGLNHRIDLRRLLPRGGARKAQGEVVGRVSNRTGEVVRPSPEVSDLSAVEIPGPADDTVGLGARVDPR